MTKKGTIYKIINNVIIN